MTNPITVSPPDFDAVADALRRLGSLVPAAEAHGILCGLLCARGAGVDELWLEQVDQRETQPSVEASVRSEARTELLGLYAATAGGLGDAGLEFEPLLPSDDCPLADRAEALGQWSQGLMYGLGLGGLGEQPRLQGEAAEFLTDVADFARGAMDTDGGEEDEEAYAEIVEYLRVGTVLVHDTLRAADSRPAPGRKLH